MKLFLLLLTAAFALSCGSSDSASSPAASTGDSGGSTTPNCVLGTHKTGECKVN